MAKGTSAKLPQLIRRLISSPPPPAIADAAENLSGDEHNLVFSRANRVTAEEIDSDWLQRIELRSLEEIARYVEATGFSRTPGSSVVLFVDNRCGLIGCEVLRPLLNDPSVSVRHILKAASNFQAHGIILATADPIREFIKRREWRELTLSLFKKGEAIGVQFLNHFVLTNEGWTTLHPAQSTHPNEGSRSDRLRRALKDIQKRSVEQGTKPTGTATHKSGPSLP